MRRYHLFITTTILVLNFMLAGVVSAGEIISVRGRGEIKPVGEAAWKRVRVGMQVDVGDALRTARRSKLVIALDAARLNVFELKEQTMLVLNSAHPGMINQLDLKKGTIYAQVEDLASGMTFEITTPSSVAGVLGTGWSVSADGGGDTVAAHQNDVYVKTFNEMKQLLAEIIVKEGFKTLIERFEKPSELMELTDRERDAWNEWKDAITEFVDRRRESGAGDESIAEEIMEMQEKTAGEIRDIKEQIEENQTDKNIEDREDDHSDSSCGGGLVSS